MITFDHQPLPSLLPLSLSFPPSSLLSALLPSSFFLFSICYYKCCWARVVWSEILSFSLMFVILLFTLSFCTCCSLFFYSASCSASDLALVGYMIIPAREPDWPRPPPEGNGGRFWGGGGNGIPPIGGGGGTNPPGGGGIPDEVVIGIYIVGAIGIAAAIIGGGGVNWRVSFII